MIAEHVPGVDRAELRHRYLDVLEEHYAPLAAGRIDFLTFRRNRLAAALDPWGDVSDELFERYVKEKERIADEMRPFPDAIATVRALRAQGIKVGVLTNGPSDFQRRKLEVSGLGVRARRDRDLGRARCREAGAGGVRAGARAARHDGGRDRDGRRLARERRCSARSPPASRRWCGCPASGAETYRPARISHRRSRRSRASSGSPSNRLVTWRGGRRGRSAPRRWL